MSVLTTASTTLKASLNSVTTVAVTVDKALMSAYHLADVGESTAAAWAADVKQTHTEDRDTRLEYRRTELALNYAEKDAELNKRLSNPEFKKAYTAHKARLDKQYSTQTSETKAIS